MKANDLQTKSSSAPLLRLSNQQDLSAIQCGQNNTSHHVCVSKTCREYPFVCQNQQCPCKTLHDFCLIMQTQSIKKYLIAKTISTEPLQNFINSTIESITDKFSLFRDKLIESALLKFQLCGFSNSQKSFLKALSEGNGSLITGEKLWKVIQNIFQDQAIILEMGKSIQRIKAYSKKFQQRMNDFMKQIENEVEDFDIFVKKQTEELQNSYGFQNLSSKKTISIIQPRDKLFLASKVIKEAHEIYTMRQFFEQKIIKSADIIYRASDQDFSFQKFHQNCDNIPSTLIVLETQFGKKLGGYTGIKWSIQQKGCYKPDQSGESFLFSLSNGDKFTLKRKQHALYLYKKQGPVFGGDGIDYDLFIADKANTNSYSYVSINEAYCNPQYKKGDQASIEKLTGNQSNGHFYIKQWEVWKIEFETNVIQQIVDFDIFY